MDKLNDKKKEVLSAAISNVKLQDAGVKDKDMDVPCVSSSSSKKVRYPTVYLNTEEVPQLKDYEYGDKIILIAEGEIVGHSKNENKHRNSESFDIQMNKIGCHKKSVK